LPPAEQFRRNDLLAAVKRSPFFLEKKSNKKGGMHRNPLYRHCLVDHIGCWKEYKRRMHSLQCIHAYCMVCYGYSSNATS
jgi:hypothetical protein